MIEVGVAQLEFRHRHAGHPGVAAGRKIAERLPVSRREILEDHEGSASLLRAGLERGAECVRHPGFVFGGAGGEMALAGGVAHHENSHGEKTGEPAADHVHRTAQGRNAFNQVLLNKKKGLDRAHRV